MAEMLEKSGASAYRMAIRNAVRGLWTGAIDYDQFYDIMLTTIRNGQTAAFYEGAKECGILPGDLTPRERFRIEQAINYENQWIDGFAQAIEEGSKANGGKLTPLFARAEPWIGRYVGLRSEARAMACADKKLKWVQGPTSDTCSSCTKLNGKVKRGSYWQERGIFPRVHGAPYLECNGFRCLCELVPTDEPCTPGPLPSLP